MIQLRVCRMFCISVSSHNSKPMYNRRTPCSAILRRNDDRNFVNRHARQTKGSQVRVCYAQRTMTQFSADRRCGRPDDYRPIMNHSNQSENTRCQVQQTIRTIFYFLGTFQIGGTDPDSQFVRGHNQPITAGQSTLKLLCRQIEVKTYKQVYI